MSHKTGLMILTLLLTLAVVTPAAAAPAVSDRLPDLRIAQLQDLSLDTVNGHLVIRFTTRFVNVGVGAFEVRGSRPDTNTTDMTVVQRIYDDAGGYRDVPTGATMYFEGAGHYHWHIRNLESYEVDRLDNGVKVGTGTKLGFCFFDDHPFRLTLPGAPQSQVYSPSTNPPPCSQDQPLALQATMGLSVGWEDTYPATLPDQFIDINGLPSGRYRLKATADANHWFQETDSSNNTTWVDFQLRNHHLRILGYGPTP